ncbi:pyridine nucleotide-disulfide oxidoreductase/dicluster-binding protein [Desulfitobacterium hafniense]|nr:pyridine nucleotide-disulfide oxidoreductase/dicluster-binding protein [Desulfitobacterium hafniense]
MRSRYLYTNDCVHGNKPQCTCACPINMDIKSFLKKLSKGNFNAAYRLLADTVLFPEVVSKLCEGKCTTVCAKYINIPMLEQACVRYAKSREPNNYSLPKKDGKFAVIGSGICGLACTLRLAAKRYDVTVFERDCRIGGSLADVMDEKTYLDEFALQFKYAPYSLALNKEIDSLDELAEYQAIFIAVGTNGDDFGLRNSWNSKSMATAEQGVFLGGEAAGADKIRAIADGIVAAASMERYIQTKSMSGQPETFIEDEPRFTVAIDRNSRQIIPLKNDLYDIDETIAESKRCIMCDCTACMDGCDFLKSMGMYPKELEDHVLSAVNMPHAAFVERVGSRTIFSCSVCGHCQSVCPRGISLENLLLDCKKSLFKAHKFPDALHDYYLRDMADAVGGNYLARLAPGHLTASYLLFPGCQTTESGADYVKSAYSYLRGVYPDTAIMLGCCGVPALWAGNTSLLENTVGQIRSDWKKMGRPTAVVMCATCLKTFRTYFPEMKCISLYELMAESGLPDAPTGPETDLAVFDPCSSREFPGMQQAVRQLARKKGANLTELPDAGKTARCCGMGGHIYPANPNLVSNMLERSMGLSDKPYITYCTNCRNLFLAEGKQCKHILDDVFGIKPLAKPYSITQLRTNRKRLKQELLQDVWGEVIMPENTIDEIQLQISDSVLSKMNNNLISEEDVRSVIRKCEETGDKLFRKDSGTFIGSRQIGIITYWVEYRPAKDINNKGVFEVLNSYSHRLMIGESNPDRVEP